MVLKKAGFFRFSFKVAVTIVNTSKEMKITCKFENSGIIARAMLSTSFF
jgi:hypothetical protein